MNPDTSERLALFVDGPNLYNSARALGFDIDYKKLLDMFRGKGRLVRAFYYTAVPADQEFSPIRPLVDWLDYNGYTMVTKRMKEFTNELGHRRSKGNMDIELAIDMLEMAQHIDHAVLLSGDGDYRRLVEVVQRRGVTVTVISTFRTEPPMVADELRRQADIFVELQDISPVISREVRRTPGGEGGGGAWRRPARPATPGDPEPRAAAEGDGGWRRPARQATPGDPDPDYDDDEDSSEVADAADVADGEAGDDGQRGGWWRRPAGDSGF